MDNEAKWYILGQGNKQYGKYTAQQMIDWYNQGKLNDESFVACSGMKSWAKFKDTELVQNVNSFTPNDSVDIEFDIPNNQTYYNQPVNTVPNQRNNNTPNNIVDDKPPFTAFEEFGIFGLTLLIGFVGLIIGIKNVKYPSRKNFSIFLIVLYIVILVFRIASFVSIGNKDISDKDLVDASNTLETYSDSENLSSILDGNDTSWETDDYKYSYDATNDTLSIEPNMHEETLTVNNPTDVKSSDFTIDKDYSFQDDDGWHTILVLTINTEGKTVALSATAYDTNGIIVDEMETWLNIPKGEQGIIELYPGYYSELEGRTDLRYEYTWKTRNSLEPVIDFGYEIEDSHKKGNAVEITVRQTGDDSDLYGHSPDLLVFKNGSCVGTGEFIIGDKLKGKGTACYVEANGRYRLKDFDTWEIYKK